MMNDKAEKELDGYQTEYLCPECGFPVFFEGDVDSTTDPWFAGVCPKCGAEYILQPTGWEVVKY